MNLVQLHLLPGSTGDCISFSNGRKPDVGIVARDRCLNISEKLTLLYKQQHIFIIYSMTESL